MSGHTLPAGDESVSAHGAWTQTFLVEGLQPRLATDGGDLDLVALFQERYEAYVSRHAARGDRPCCFLSLHGQRHNTNQCEEPAQLPRGRCHLRDILGAP